MRIIFLSLFLLTYSAFSMPAQILLMRHAEKPLFGNELSSQGWKRAMALPALFDNRVEFSKLGKPAALFAMSPQRKRGSVRAIQTLKFVSEQFKIPIISSYTRNEVKSLAAEIRNDKALDGKMTIICWEHKVLAEFAAEFGAQDFLAWPKNQYDRIWALSYSKDNKLVKFENLPERLLPSDSKN